VTFTHLFAGSLLILALTGCGRTTDAKAPPKEVKIKAVEAEHVRRDTMRRDVEVVGTLAAQDEVTISSQSEGVVLKVLADLGDVVKADQALVELDPEKLRYSLDQQKATLARALTKYGATASGELPAEKDTPDARRAEAELAQARQVRQRARDLYQSKLIAQQAMDDAEAVFQSKQASYDLALQNARNLKADIDVADATAKLAARQLRDAFVRAPFDAYVQKRMVTVGQLVGAQTPVMTLVKVGPLKIVAEIPERMAPWVRVNQVVSFQADAYPDRTFNATVTRISPAVNTQTRSFSFEAIAPNEKQLLKPGTFARVHVETALTEQALTIPYRGVQYRFGVSRAFVVTGDKLSVRELKLGDRHGDRVEILEGLKEGEAIALTDIDNLVDGMKVTITSGAG
jgi:RND family efflux transporter MFP subunit